MNHNHNPRLQPITPMIRQPLNRAWIAAVFLLLCSSYTPLSAALSSDRQQPIHISSDSAQRSESEGITTYTGDVEMNQGSLKILADEVVIHSSENKISKIVATGTPAEYQQIPEENKQLVIAKGNTIEYLIRDEKLQLMNNASLHQSDGTTMSGDKINYDIKASVVRAEGRDNSPSPRIHMVIPPKQ